MKNIIITMMMVLTFISLTSAMYSGETFEKRFDYPIINCSIENNTYNLDGLNLTWSKNILTLKTDINYQPDNFTLVCWINQSYYSSHSGSNHREEVIIEYFCENNETICDDFPSCENKEFVQRYCITNCGEVTIDYKVCEKEFINETIDEIVIIEEEDSLVPCFLKIIFTTLIWIIVLYILTLVFLRWVWK